MIIAFTFACCAHVAHIPTSNHSVASGATSLISALTLGSAEIDTPPVWSKIYSSSTSDNGVLFLHVGCALHVVSTTSLCFSATLEGHQRKEGAVRGSSSKIPLICFHVVLETQLNVILLGSAFLLTVTQAESTTAGILDVVHILVPCTDLHRTARSFVWAAPSAQAR